MSDNKRQSGQEILFLYTEIGRGHPSYLDGITRHIKANHPYVNFSITNVFDLSHGVSLLVWKLVRFLYHFGAQGGIVTRLYTKLRDILGSNPQDGLLVKLLGRDVRSALTGYMGLVVVAHPLLAHILGPQNRVIYQHGEFAVPEEAIPKNCWKILVPDKSAAEVFRKAGISEDVVVITGQCVDDNIVPVVEGAFGERIKRFKGESPLTAGLFTSGALPGPHIEILLRSARSLAKSNYRIFLFTALSQSYFNRAKSYLRESHIEYSTYPDTSQLVCLVHCKSREEEDNVAADLFSSFDFFLAPAHERIHWSLGLGLPQMMCCPHIGTFSPHNAARVLQQGTGIEIQNDKESDTLADTIKDLVTTGRLMDMAQNGFGPDSINGFRSCAELIIASMRDTS